MLLDSHRLRFHPDRIVTTSSISRPREETLATMPCSKRFAAALEETETTPDGVRMYTWRAVRRQQLRDLRQPVRWVVFFMALIEVQRVGLTNIIFQGKHDTKAAGPEDYGVRLQLP